MKYLFCTLLFVAALAYMAPSMVFAQGYYSYPQQPQPAPQSPPQWDNGTPSAAPLPPPPPPPFPQYRPDGRYPSQVQPPQAVGSINVPTGLLDQSSEQAPEPRCGNAQMFIIDPDGRATHKQIPVCQINGIWTVRQ
jgi:hypothetical protein